MRLIDADALMSEILQIPKLNSLAIDILEKIGNAPTIDIRKKDSGVKDEDIMIKIWIDDIREMPKDYTVWLRSTMDATHYIRKLNPKTEFLLDLDHDAGDYHKFGGDYYKILDYCEAHNYHPIVHFHSMNPAGVDKMRLIARRNNWREVYNV